VTGLRYTVGMETAVLVLLALVVCLVAIDAIGKLDERGTRHREPPPVDEGSISTQKIVVDMSKRS
jgi:hypothetical protein